MILSKTKKVEFLMVGDGSLLHSCKSLAKSLGITSKIQFLGSRDDALDIMKEKMHLFLAPSLREGLPIVGLEALSLGVPIIATDVPGWKDLVFKGETGYLTPINDCSGMAHYCIEMLNNSQLRWEISQKAYHLASSKYSLDVTAGGYLNIYINLLDTKQPTIELERIN
jgi:glycosyltransferase involved in cell wall biosynthesis